MVGGCASASALLVAVCFTVAQSQDLPLTTKRGPIIGIRRNPNPASGVPYDAFIGIPYAEQPDRFQLPVAKQNWTAARVTQKDGAVCPQPNSVGFSEDCLFINVFTPVDASTLPASGKLPVMVFIHGSAFTFSSSSSELYGPDFLVPQGVVLVTMNYRLGANGFLTLGSKVAPGNLGLHDTLLALQWVQDEISVFGGDPTKVTLFGESAGSAMTQFHYLSPLSTEMFTKAMTESGSAMAEWTHVTPEEGARRAKLLAQAVNCDTTNDNQTILLSCLQKANISDIVKYQSITLPDDSTVNGNSLPFVPVLDTSQTATRPFFNDTIDNLLKAATARNKPLLTGFNTDEGILKVSGEGYWKGAQANLAAFIPQAAARNMNGDLKSTLVNEISSKYFPGTVDDDKVEDLVKIYTDFMFAYPSIQMTRYFANITYGYLFAYNGAWAGTSEYFAKYKLTGVAHGDELSYLFFRTNGMQDLESCTLNKPNLEMRDQMVQWWTSFAKTGVPNTAWPTVANGGYLVIDKTNTIMNATAFESQYYDFWDGIRKRSVTSSSTFSVQLSFISLLISVMILVIANSRCS